MSGVAPVPSLDAIAADPAKVTTLPPAAAIALYSRAVVVLAALGPALSMSAGPRREAPAPAEADLLDVEQAARRLGKSTSWLYRNARALPFTVRVGVSLRFDPRRLAQYVAERAGAGA